MKSYLTINELKIELVRKAIKNVHLSVHPPSGRVRISAPRWVNKDVIRAFAISKLPWIRKHQQKIERQAREAPREYLERESHFLWGKRYLLTVEQFSDRWQVQLKHDRLHINVHPTASYDKKKKIVEQWSRKILKDAIKELLSRWEESIGVSVRYWGVKKMKTKWGSCNTKQQRIWLNLDLVRKPPECLEYVLVHELVHLLERKHNERFVAFMDSFLPKWKSIKKELNAYPLSHSEWDY